MFEKDFALQCEENTLVPVKLKSWMELTDTPEDVQKEMANLMKAELVGGSKTGFHHITKNHKLCLTIDGYYWLAKKSRV